MKTKNWKVVILVQDRAEEDEPFGTIDQVRTAFRAKHSFAFPSSFGGDLHLEEALEVTECFTCKDCKDDSCDEEINGRCIHCHRKFLESGGNLLADQGKAVSNERPGVLLPECRFDTFRCRGCKNGAVRVYPDGREVCQDTPAGWREYKRRVGVMVERQRHRCSLCRGRLSLGNATFEHQRRRGMGAAWRDDRITKDGQGWNGAAHWVCNSERG